MILVAKSRLEVILLIFCFVVSQPTFETDLITDHFRERKSLCFYHEVFFENLEINERISSHACHVFLGLCSPHYSFTHASTLFKFVSSPLA